jgi:hypothetical protein
LRQENSYSIKERASQISKLVINQWMLIRGGRGGPSNSELQKNSETLSYNFLDKTILNILRSPNNCFKIHCFAMVCLPEGHLPEFV